VEGSHPRPTTTIRTTADALVDVFDKDRDITHLVADGSVEVLSGDYYDLIMLSRVLGRLRRVHGVAK
jgi:hypothetical protein